MYLSHDDVDHTGNLDEVMTTCPNASLVASWAMFCHHALSPWLSLVDPKRYADHCS